MLTIPEIRTGPLVSHYVNDEIHINGKLEGRPRAVVSFVAVDANGARIPGASPITAFLSGAAYDQWYAAWISEAALYSKILELLVAGVEGITVSGDEFTRIGGVANASVAETVEEVVNVPV